VKGASQACNASAAMSQMRCADERKPPSNLLTMCSEQSATNLCLGVP
jgi:hypothetical protein